MSKKAVILAFALAVSTAFADPCPQTSNTGNAPVSDSNLKTISTSAEAIKDLPDAPVPKIPGVKVVSMNAVPDEKGVIHKKPWIRIEFKLEGETGEQKPHIVHLIAMDFAAINDPKNPNHATALANINTAFNIYIQIINECQTTSSGASAANPGIAEGKFQTRANSKAVAISGSPGVASSCGPNTISQYYGFLNSNQNINFDSKIELGSMIMSRLSPLYGAKTMSSVTPMEQVWEALRTGLGQAGVCRDQHTFLAYTMNGLGFQEVGTLATDWNNGEETGGHVITFLKDPTSGQFIFANYEDFFSTGEKWLSDASRAAGQSLNSTSEANVTETGTTGKPVLHVTQTERQMALEGTLDRAADLDRPMLDISVGDEETEASFRKVLARSNKNAFGVYVVAAGADPSNPIAFGSAGISGKLETDKPITKNTELDLSLSTRMGFMDVHDQIPDNGHGRNEMSFVGDSKAEADFAWHTDGGNQGKVGVQAQFDANVVTTNLKLQAGFLPYDVIKVVAEDDPSKDVQFHGFSSFFLYGQSNWNTALALHHQDDAAGVKLTRTVHDGKVEFSTDTMVHDFAGNAIGVHNESDVTFKTQRHGDFSIGNDLGIVKPLSSDPYYVFAPVTDAFSFKYSKSTDHGEFDAYVKYRYENENTFTLMQKDFNDPSVWSLHPGTTFGITWRPKKKDDSQ